MSEQEMNVEAAKVREGIILARKRMLERKAKLGENVVIADENGMPISVPASELLKRSV